MWLRNTNLVRLQDFEKRLKLKEELRIGPGPSQSTAGSVSEERAHQDQKYQVLLDTSGKYTAYKFILVILGCGG